MTVEERAELDLARAVLRAAGYAIISRRTWIEINRIRRRAAAGLPVSIDEVEQIAYALTVASED